MAHNFFTEIQWHRFGCPSSDSISQVCPPTNKAEKILWNIIQSDGKARFLITREETVNMKHGKFYPTNCEP